MHTHTQIIRILLYKRMFVNYRNRMNEKYGWIISYTGKICDYIESGFDE